LGGFIFGLQIIHSALVIEFECGFFEDFGLDMRVWRVFEGIDLYVVGLQKAGGASREKQRQ
jgi:hypothetical protein